MLYPTREYLLFGDTIRRYYPDRYYNLLATFAPGVAREFYLIESRIVLFYCV